MLRIFCNTFIGFQTTCKNSRKNKSISYYFTFFLVQVQGQSLDLSHQQEGQQPNQNCKENLGQNLQVIGHHQGQDHHHPKEDPDHQVQSLGHHHQCLKRLIFYVQFVFISANKCSKIVMEKS